MVLNLVAFSIIKDSHFLVLASVKGCLKSTKHIAVILVSLALFPGKRNIPEISTKFLMELASTLGDLSHSILVLTTVEVSPSFFELLATIDSLGISVSVIFMPLIKWQQREPQVSTRVADSTVFMTVNNDLTSIAVFTILS